MYALWIRIAVPLHRTESEVFGQLIDHVVECDCERAVAERRQGLAMYLRLPHPIERQKREGHEPPIRVRWVRVVLFARGHQRQLLEIGFLVEVGIRPKVKRKLAVEVAGAARRSDNFKIQVRHTVGQSAAVRNITPTLRKEVRFLGFSSKRLIAIEGRVPARNDFSEMGHTRVTRTIICRICWYGSQHRQIVLLNLGFLTFPREGIIQSMVRSEQEICVIERQESESVDVTCAWVRPSGGYRGWRATMTDQADAGVLFESDEIQVRCKLIPVLDEEKLPRLKISDVVAPINERIPEIYCL